MKPSLEKRGPAKAFVALVLLAMLTAPLKAHPGSGIAADARKQVYFVDTGQGVWRIDTQGKLSLIHTEGYHWMALDEKGHFAKSTSLGDFDGGTFERVTPRGAIREPRRPVRRVAPHIRMARSTRKWFSERSVVGMEAAEAAVCKNSIVNGFSSITMQAAAAGNAMEARFRRRKAT